MFDILLLAVLSEGIVVVRGKVVDVAKLTVGCCVVMVGSTAVLLMWSVDKRDCSEQGDGDT